MGQFIIGLFIGSILGVLGIAIFNAHEPTENRRRTHNDRRLWLRSQFSPTVDHAGNVIRFDRRQQADRRLGSITLTGATGE